MIGVNIIGAKKERSPFPANSAYEEGIEYFRIAGSLGNRRRDLEAP